MPKLKRSAEQKKQDEWQKDDAAIRGSVGKWMGETGYNIDSLAARIGMPRSSLYRRLQHPEEFRLCELRKIRDVIGEVGTLWQS